MDKPQERLTDKELESLQNIVSDTLASICAMADKHTIDRDSMLKYFADMITAFAELASIKNYKANHSCNCKHNHNSNSDEPCCRCDRQMTNADRIRSMSDEDLLDFICSIETYDQGSVITIKGGTAMCSVSEVEKWLQSPAEVSETDNL